MTWLHKLTWGHWFVAAVLILAQALSMWLNYRNPNSRSGKALLLLIASAILLLITSLRPLRLNPLMAEYASRPAQYALNDRAFDLIEAEHAKAIDEIKLRMEQEDQWFHNKFLLLGSLFASLLTYMAFVGTREIHTEGDPLLERRLGELLQSNAVCSILALASTISLAIDIHIRNNVMVIQQLALWISNYVEPALLQASPEQMAAGGFLPWEQFLRAPGAGMHQDDLYGFSFYPHLHFLTWVIYILYLASLLTFTQQNRDPEQSRIALAGFVLVHSSLAALAWISHTAPPAFESKIIPYVDWWASGLASPLFYLCFWLLLIVGLAPQFRYMWSHGD